MGERERFVGYDGEVEGDSVQVSAKNRRLNGPSKGSGSILNTNKAQATGYAPKNRSIRTVLMRNVAVHGDLV